MGVRLITRRRAGAIVLLLAVLTPLVGCSRSASQASPPAVMASSSEAPAPTTAPRPSTASPAVASPAEQLTPSATLEPIPSGLPADIEHAMRQRQLFGLRSDLAWVQQVAADPRAQMEALDFPMLPEEEAEFGSRQRAYEAAVEVIQRYAASHVDQFGGVYTDQPNHVVVTLWTDDPEGHLADLNKLGAVAKPSSPARSDGQSASFERCRIRSTGTGSRRSTPRVRGSAQTSSAMWSRSTSRVRTRTRLASSSSTTSVPWGSHQRCSS